MSSQPLYSKFTLLQSLNDKNLFAQVDYCDENCVIIIMFRDNDMDVLNVLDDLTSNHFLDDFKSHVFEISIHALQLGYHFTHECEVVHTQIVPSLVADGLLCEWDTIIKKGDLISS